MPLVAVITDKISLNEEMISAVDELLFLDRRLVPILRPAVDEIWLEILFVIMHLFYSRCYRSAVNGT